MARYGMGAWNSTEAFCELALHLAWPRIYHPRRDDSIVHSAARHMQETAGAARQRCTPNPESGDHRHAAYRRVDEEGEERWEGAGAGAFRALAGVRFNASWMLA